MVGPGLGALTNANGKAASDFIEIVSPRLGFGVRNETICEFYTHPKGSFCPQFRTPWVRQHALERKTLRQDAMRLLLRLKHKSDVWACTLSLAIAADCPSKSLMVLWVWRGPRRPKGLTFARVSLCSRQIETVRFDRFPCMSSSFHSPARLKPGR